MHCTVCSTKLQYSLSNQTSVQSVYPNLSTVCQTKPQYILSNQTSIESVQPNLSTVQPNLADQHIDLTRFIFLVGNKFPLG